MFHDREITYEIRLLEYIIARLNRIELELAKLSPRTPTHIIFKEITMNPEGPGVQQVWQGSILPAGSAFPDGTTFTAVPSDPTVGVSVDSTGLSVTITYPTTFESNPSNPFSVAWSTSVFVPQPSTDPSQLTATITPTAPPPTPTKTPTSVSFVQVS